MTKLLVNFTRKIVYLLWLKNSGIIVIPVNVTGKYSNSSFKIRRWQCYCLHNLAPFRFSLEGERFSRTIALAAEELLSLADPCERTVIEYSDRSLTVL